MVVFMKWGVSDDKVVDGREIFDTMIYNMVANRKWDIGDGRMTYSVTVFNAIIFDMMTSRKWDIVDDGEVTCGVVVPRKEGKVMVG